MGKELFNISSVETVFVQICPQIRKPRLLFQISYNLGNGIHLSDFLILLFIHQFALHGPYFGRQAAVRKQTSHKSHILNIRLYISAARAVWHSS